MPSGTKDDTLQADLARGEELEMQAKWEELNQSMLGHVEKIVKDNPPAADLWPYFRKANADYMRNRTKLVEKPKSDSEHEGELALVK